MPMFQYVVLTDAQPGCLEEFEGWYDRRHLRDAVAVPGVRSARRYRLTIADEVEPPPWCSLAIDEIEADDPLEVARNLSARANTAAMPISDALGWDTRLKMMGELVGEVSASEEGRPHVPGSGRS